MNRRVEIFNITREEFFKYFSFTFICYAVPLIAIGLSNYPYLDDTSRRAMGYTAFGNDYSRWGSEFLAWILQGSRHLVDTGLTNFIVTALILALSSVILVSIISKLGYLSLFVSLMIGLNPWSLGLFSFKFDSPFMAVSVLMSIIPFLFWEKRQFAVVSFFALFLMYNTYQASSGIFLVIFLIKIYRSLTQRIDGKKLRTNVLMGGLSFLLPTIAYFVQLKVLPVAAGHSSNSMLSQNIFLQPFTNVRLFLSAFKYNSAKVWIAVFAVLLVVFVIKEIINSDNNLAFSSLYLAVFFVLGTFLSFGIYLFLQQLTPALRYIYGLPFFLACLAIMLFDKQEEKWRALTIINRFVPALLSFFILQFSFTYAGVLENQRESLQSQTMGLANSLEKVDLKGVKLYFSDFLFSDSATLKNSQKNYPILNGGYTQLFLSNTQTSQELIRLQIMQNLYQNVQPAETISQAQEQTGEFTQAQEQNITDGKAVKVLENDCWIVYTCEKEVYIVAK
ncbi:glucosyltransferase domain-containing protein [Lactovum odontotermitis]